MKIDLLFSTNRYAALRSSQEKSEMETAVVKPADTVPSQGDKAEATRRVVKFEVFGEEMIEKQVKPSGNSGRVYLPPDWVGCRVKVIKTG
jgi:putative transposon-encoded protein